jgi:DNA-binding transcriptional regulator YdaS (Cro superfamily)
MQKLKSVADVVMVLGGSSALAAALAIQDTNIANWKANKRIPANQFLVINALLQARGCEADAELFAFRKMRRKG